MCAPDYDDSDDHISFYRLQFLVCMMRYTCESGVNIVWSWHSGFDSEGRGTHTNQGWTSFDHGTMGLIQTSSQRNACVNSQVMLECSSQCFKMPELQGCWRKHQQRRQRWQGCRNAGHHKPMRHQKDSLKGAQPSCGALTNGWELFETDNPNVRMIFWEIGSSDARGARFQNNALMCLLWLGWAIPPQHCHCVCSLSGRSIAPSRPSQHVLKHKWKKQLLIIRTESENE